MFFIILISVAVGVGLKHVKESSQEVQKSALMIQTNLILEDILKILKSSKELEQIDSAEDLFRFLSENSFKELESSGVKVILNLKSAGSRFNVNALSESNNSVNVQRVNLLKDFLNRRSINGSLADILLDMMSGYRDDMSYNSNIFDTKPTLFRDRITSREHLNEALQYYSATYHDDLTKKMDIENLFYYDRDKNSSIDLNYATDEVWELILSCDRAKAKELKEHKGVYTKLQDLELDEKQMSNLSSFRTTFFGTRLSVAVDIVQNEHDAKVRFEYDLKTKKATDFVYEI